MPLTLTDPTPPPQATRTPAPQALPTPAGRRIKTALAWGLGLALLAWLLSRTPLAQVQTALARPSALMWGSTLLALLASYGLRGARLQVVLDLDAQRPAPRRWLGVRTDALRVILMHNAAVNLLPMRAGELSFPWLASRQLGLPVARAVACLLWMRVQDLAVLALMGVALWPGPSTPQRLAALTVLVGGALGLQWALGRWFARHPMPGQATATGWPARLQQLRTALMERAHHRPAAWALTLANWGLKLAAGASLLSAISTAPWLTAWAGALGGELAAIVPLQGPAGFGTYEAGVWAGMATGLPRGSPVLSQAIGAALALHVCFLLCAVIAGAAATALSWLEAQRSVPAAPPTRHPG